MTRAAALACVAAIASIPLVWAEMSWEQEVVAEKMAFMMCDSDKMVGLTWREVESCIQRYAGLLEDKGIPLPTFDNFHAADLLGDDDGVLTMEEWMAWAQPPQP